VRAALADGADYVVNLDQDTDLPEDYVSIALGLFARGNPVTRLGIVCVDAVNGAPALPTWISPEGFGLVPEAIQTGFVISRECLETVGLFDERLVIDCVDTEYCLRVRDHGFRIAVARGTDIRHSIGRRAELRPFGVPLRHRRTGRIATYQYHSPFRRYYIARNNIDLILRNLTRRPRWVLAVLRREMGGMIVSMVSGPQRVAQVLAITTGTVHGLFRRRGMIPGWLKALIT
jgi:rhamnosyltransferase